MLRESDYDVKESVFTVSELTRNIKIVLEGTWPDVWVQGEISNFKRHFSGHCYFSLKDTDAQISCVLWKGRQFSMHFIPTDGMQVIVRSRLTLYEKQGKYQLDVNVISPLGVGDLRLAFEHLKQKLYAEGLFDSHWKKTLPKFPRRIGIVTSPTGAAFQDILSVLTRRFPAVQVILNPVHVQGEGAAEEISRAIKEFNEYGEVDVLIVGRGGGSLEDLWAFNEEVVARAIFASKIPVVSAVGHEIDFSISDFVADLRAPTPSAAAELVVPDKEEVRNVLENLNRKFIVSLQNKINTARDKIKAIVSSYALNRPVDLVRQNAQRLDELFHRMVTGYIHLLSLRSSDLSRLIGHISALNPYAVLERGYSICYKLPDGTIIRKSSAVSPEDKIRIQLFKGSLLGMVEQSITMNGQSYESEKL